MTHPRRAHSAKKLASIIAISDNFTEFLAGTWRPPAYSYALLRCWTAPRRPEGTRQPLGRRSRTPPSAVYMGFAVTVRERLPPHCIWVLRSLSHSAVRVTFVPLRMMVCTADPAFLAWLDAKPWFSIF
jgi:hypothetical protein